MSELIPANHLSIDEHVSRIRSCLERTRESIFETIVSIRECRDQLGKEVFQREIADRLGMSPSTLNRWISIGDSSLVMDHRESLPPVFTSLYKLTQVEKQYLTYYGDKVGPDRLESLFKKDQITITSESQDITKILKTIKTKNKTRSDRKRQKKFRSKKGESEELPSNTSTLSELIEKRQTFRTFLIPNLPTQLINRWGSEDYSEEDILNEFSLITVRHSVPTDSLTCLIGIPMNKINVGIKVMGSIGFTYQETYVSPQRKESLIPLSKELVIIRGGFGRSKKKTIEIPSTKTTDLMDYCEKVSDGPHLLVFEEVGRKDWVSMVLRKTK